ncbi:uncharacterized protein [Littorina saxatilis]
MISKTSTAVNISVILLYNILRLSAAGFLASFALVHNRQSLQKVSNFMWLMGTWGVNYTMLDMSIEQIFVVLRPDLAHTKVKAINAVKKTFFALLLGLCASAMALIHAIGTAKSSFRNGKLASCEETAFYYSYSIDYSLYVVGFLHFLFPLTLLLVAVLFLIIVYIGTSLRSSTLYDRYASSPTIYHFVKYYKPQRSALLCVMSFHLGFNGMYYYTLVQLMTKEEAVAPADRSMYTLYFQIAELCVLCSTILTPFTLLLWPNCRHEAKMTVSCSSSESGPTSTNISRSNHSLSAFSAL